MIYLLGFVAGAASVFVFNFWHDSQKIRTIASDKRLPTQKLISPLLECAVREPDPKDLENPLASFSEEIQNFMNKSQNKSTDLKADIYFQDLIGGTAIDVGDNISLRAGSLLKIPLVMAYFKWSESEPDVLNKKVIFDQKDSLKLYDVQGVKPSKTLQLGQSYTIAELMHAAIVYSDNVAASLLEHYDNRSGLKKVAVDLDIPVHEGVPPLREPHIKDYASYFRVLFNAAYLDQNKSNEFLKLLSESEYKDGLVAGVPTEVLVSHKFGEATGLNNSDVHFLNDCGIIYLPKRPYLLCISVHGKDESQMTPLVQKISNLVYKKMEESF
ncbi:MAG: serine hydrolase [Bdellovibrio sp.]|nr:serine hydrolase [Bdellovibrio sp.]